MFDKEPPQEIQKIADEAIWLVEEELGDGRLQSKEMRDDLLSKLHTVLAISTDRRTRERANELITDIEMRYGKRGTP